MVAEPVRAEEDPSPRCPKCGGPVQRVSRRFEDRLISLVRPMHRYYCKGDPRCRWEGLLPARPASGKGTGPEARAHRRRKAALVLVLLVLLLLAVAAGLGSLLAGS